MIPATSDNLTSPPPDRIASAPSAPSSVPSASFDDLLKRAADQPPRDSSRNSDSGAPPQPASDAKPRGEHKPQGAEKPTPRPEGSKPAEAQQPAHDEKDAEKSDSTESPILTVGEQPPTPVAPRSKPDPVPASKPIAAVHGAQQKPSLKDAAALPGADPSPAAASANDGVKTAPHAETAAVNLESAEGAVSDAPPATAPTTAAPRSPKAALGQLQPVSVTVQPEIVETTGATESVAPVQPVAAQQPAPPAPATKSKSSAERGSTRRATTDNAPRDVPAPDTMAAATAVAISAPSASTAIVAGTEQPSADAVHGVTLKTDAPDAAPAPMAAADSAPPATASTSSPTERLTVQVGPRSAPADDARATEHVDRARFVQRVARAFSALEGSGGPLRLRLSPPELGSLKIEIRLDNGQMHARVEAETSAARHLLLDNLPALRDRLAQHDIQITRFDVDLMQDRGGTPSNAGGQDRRDGDSSFGRGSAATGDQPAAAAIPENLRTHNGQLNVVI